MTTYYLVAAFVALLAGAVGWLAASVSLRSKIAGADSTIENLNRELAGKEADLRLERDQCNRLAVAHAKLETELAQTRESLADEEQRLADMKTSFKAVSGEALKSSSEQFLNLAGQTFGKHVESIHGLLVPMKETLSRMEKDRVDASSVLREQLKELTKTTTGLETALRKPQVRGSWGELVLRNAVEIAGMSQYCDFAEQTSLEGEEGRFRPDMTVRLPGGRTVVVDSKAPLTKFRAALEATDETERIRFMREHAEAVRNHMKALSRKAYWDQFKDTPDFVILFLPGESFFSAALEQDQTLIDDGIRSRVVLATPTTLIVTLRTIAFCWQQQSREENARKIAETGTELYSRLAVFSEHFLKVRDRLEHTDQAYNEMFGSWESRVMPGIRALKELGAAPVERKIAEIEPLDTVLRKPSRELQAPSVDNGADPDQSGVDDSVGG